MNYYLRYMAFPFAMLMALLTILNGGDALFYLMGIGLLVILLGDALLGDEVEDSNPQFTFLLNIFMYAHLPLLLLILVAFMWQIAPGDWLSIGASLESLGWNVMGNHAEFSLLDGLMSGVIVAVMIGAGGTIVGHELTHRTSDKVAMFFGRWLLAFSNDCSFSIEHVYGHHVRLGTADDPATARRGENTYRFIVRSTVGCYLGAWSLEKARLDKIGASIWGPKSRMMSGNLMSLALFVLAFSAAGWFGVVCWLVTSMAGKSLLEFVNFIEHYGIVRNRMTTPVMPRHSWNSNKRFSSVWMYNLTRHSDHHSRGDAPFWDLKAYPESLMMPYGYAGTILLSAFPPLWRRVVDPMVLEWDRHYASEEELALAKKANEESGSEVFLQACSAPLYAV
ncbi:MAG: alkane 1-monooxygenase [Gammaproteobacteria bacterium]|nr:MAG: alkane 1-monooxygenase [Gammaproteobacteria bacterium]